MSFRVGIGNDVHKLKTGFDLSLGGIVVPHTKGTVGHSDGDVLIHAIIDALLGAANLNDIGTLFPDTDIKYKGIDSKVLLQETARLIHKKGYSIINIDSTICLQTPKIKEHIPAMKIQLANTLQIKEEQISVKATTTERLGFAGREEGVSAYAIVLLKP